MKLIKENPQRKPSFAGNVELHSSICYDLVVSLRVLANPRTFTRARRWAADRFAVLSAEHQALAKFYFAGYDTALGYGAARLISELPASAGPSDLIAAVRASSSTELALFMLDTGETPPEQLDAFRAVLAGSATTVDPMQGLEPGWARRCRRILADPDRARDELAELLEAHDRQIFREHIDEVTRLTTNALEKAEELLRLLPPLTAIEQLAGGLRLSDELQLDRILLAPSAFVYPYMSARVDETTREALVIFGVDNDLFDSYEPVQVGDELVASLKAISDRNRLTILRLLSDGPLYTSDLVSRLRLGQPTVHHHLHQLRTAGLVRQERDRHGMRYSLRRDATDNLLHVLSSWLTGEEQDDPALPTTSDRNRPAPDRGC